jgi:hypothetical protein
MHSPSTLCTRLIVSTLSSFIAASILGCTIGGVGAGGGGSESLQGGDDAHTEGGDDNASGGDSVGGDSIVEAACDVTIPDSYDGTNFETNGSIELEAHVRLKAGVDAMKAAEADDSVLPAAADLLAYFNTSSLPNLLALTQPAYAIRIEGWLETFADAAGKHWEPAFALTDGDPDLGGIYGSWIFSNEGIDLRQAIEKGMFGATHYFQAAQISAADPQVANVDRVLALYGAHPSFPRADNEVAHPDRYTAVYAKRRENPEASAGLYTQIKTALITAQATAGGGSQCEQSYRNALHAALQGWERVLAATVVYYAKSASTKLSGADQALHAEALHSIGEMVGFLGGFRGQTGDARIITDAQIDASLALLGVPAGGPVTTYAFVTDAGTEVSKLNQLRSELASIYGFTADELTSFETNY